MSDNRHGYKAYNPGLNMDCMEYMSSLPDKAFDLAVVDPQYGGGATVQERERENCTAAGQNATQAAQNYAWLAAEALRANK